MEGQREFHGREEFNSNIMHTMAALAIWLGAIHFNFLLILFSILCLSFSKCLLWVTLFFLFTFLPLPYSYFRICLRLAIIVFCSGCLEYLCFSWSFPSMIVANLGEDSPGCFFFSYLYFLISHFIFAEPGKSNLKIILQVYM